MRISKIYFAAIIIISGIISSCEDRELVPNVCLNCEFSCLLDTMPWEATVTGCSLWENFINRGDTLFSIQIEESNSLDGSPDLLSFHNIPAIPGQYILGTDPSVFLNEPSVKLTVTKYSGQPKGSFGPTDSLNSFINVELIDKQTREWRVNFHLELVVNGNPWSPSPDTIYPRNFSITEGFAKGTFPD